MERDAAISYGASSFLLERLMRVSDAYQMVFCTVCSTPAVSDAATKMYKTCRLCGSNSFGRYVIPYVYKLLMHYGGALGMYLRLEFVTPDQYIDMIMRKTQPSEGINLDDVVNQLIDIDEGLSDEQAELADKGLDTDFTEVYD